VLSSFFTNPFKFSSKAFLARILESDKAENFGSLLVVVEITGFSTTASIGFVVSVVSDFNSVFVVLLLLESSTIE
jgi:hypothetical protein